MEIISRIDGGIGTTISGIPLYAKRYQTEKEVQWCLSERRRQTVPIIEKWT